MIAYNSIDMHLIVDILLNASLGKFPSCFRLSVGGTILILLSRKLFLDLGLNEGERRTRPPPTSESIRCVEDQPWSSHPLLISTYHKK